MREPAVRLLVVNLYAAFQSASSRAERLIGPVARVRSLGASLVSEGDVIVDMNVNVTVRADVLPADIAISIEIPVVAHVLVTSMIPDVVRYLVEMPFDSSRASALRSVGW